jgi:hypothetical protein
LTIFLTDVLLTLALIKQAKFFICDSSGKCQNDLDDQDLMLATVHTYIIFFFSRLNRFMKTFPLKINIKFTLHTVIQKLGSGQLKPTVRIYFIVP